MSALDRALIRAYRQDRGGAASYRPPTSAPAVAPHISHPPEAVLVGPHYRIDAPHRNETDLEVSSISVGQWTTFRVDVGATGVPVGPRHAASAYSGNASSPAVIQREQTETVLAAESSPVPAAEARTRTRTRSASAPLPTGEPAATATILRPGSAPVRIAAPASAVVPVATAATLSAPLPAPKPGLVSKADIQRPQLIVDQLLWPELCDELEHKLLEGKVRVTGSMGFDKHRAVAFVGADAGAGVSTALLTVARRLGAEGTHVTIADANPHRPALADLLSVRITQGLESLVAGEATFDDVLIESLADQAVLAPLAAPCGNEQLTSTAAATVSLWSRLRDLNEVLLIDAGSLESSAAAGSLVALYQAARLDGVFLVCDCRATTPQQVIGLVRELKSAGITVLGTIENFCPNVTA